MGKPDRKPDPDFEHDYDTPDVDYDDVTQDGHELRTDPDFGEGSQDAEYEVVDPDAEESSQE